LQSKAQAAGHTDFYRRMQLTIYQVLNISPFLQSYYGFAIDKKGLYEGQVFDAKGKG
jgi:hypothetical protein